MRLEWGPAISHRRWDLMEAFAKREPSQQLCDTAQNLLEGLTEKADRRALKKVLYLLAERGFTPTVAEPEEKRAGDGPITVFSSQLSHPNIFGGRVFSFTAFNGLMARMLSVFIFERQGKGLIKRATIFKNALHDFDVIRAKEFGEGEWVDIAPAYLAARVKRAVDLFNSMHSQIKGPWLKILEVANDSAPHPALSFKLPEPNPSARKHLVETHSSLLDMRAGIPDADRIWEEIQPIYQMYRWDEARCKRELHTFFLDNRTYFFSDEWMEDHLNRLYDLAYISHVKKTGDTEGFLDLAYDLEARRSRSDYAELILRNIADNIRDEMAPDDMDWEDDIQEFARAA